jgi:Carboxypeptidase regulatory-like domain
MAGRKRSVARFMITASPQMRLSHAQSIVSCKRKSLPRRGAKLALSPHALLGSKPLLLLAFMLSLWAVSGTAAAQMSSPQPAKSGGSFTLSGSVIDSVTGESIGHALVRIAGSSQRTGFSDGEGHFQFDGLPAGRVILTAQKPGYFSQPEFRRGANKLLNVGPDTGSVVVKLTPQSVIFGRVTDATGQPIERVPVHLTARAVRDGRKHWEARGQQQTDEDGRYRFANLMPGTYYLAAEPARDEVRILPGAEKPKTGYPSVYYPGVPDLASASPIQLAAGQHAQADFSMTSGPVYHISGSVIGYALHQGVGFQFLSQSGDDLSLPIKFNAETGRFDVDSVPPGNYVVKAFSQAGPDQPLRAEAHLNVAASIEDLHLVLGPAISIPVTVRMESRASSNQSSAEKGIQAAPVAVRLISSDPTTAESYSTIVRGRPGAYSLALQNVEPGKYSVDLIPHGAWYVQSAQYGLTNLLSDDLTVASAGQTYPIEIVLRDDGAILTGTVRTSDGTYAEATVVVVPEPASKVAPRVTYAFAQNGFTVNGLAPGDYLIYAFDYAEGLEYSNPDVLQAYASQAAHVTLSANQKSQVSLDLIRTGEGD